MQISHIVQSARVRAAGRSTIGILRSVKCFSLVLKSAIFLNQTDLVMSFVRYKNDNELSPILLIRGDNRQTDILQFYPLLDSLLITFNDTLVAKTLSSFEQTKTLDISEISHLAQECASSYGIKLDVSYMEEEVKTKILFNRPSRQSNSYFLTVVLQIVLANDTSKVFDQISVNDSSSFTTQEMNAIIGRAYVTRGIKRTYEEDNISVEPNQNIYHRKKTMQDQRDLLHLKDTHHLTDSAFNAIFQYLQSKRKFYSLKEMERLRKKTNEKFRIIVTSTSAYVKFEYAVRTAIFVARKYDLKLDQYKTLSIRFNMDGTLIGNKHIVAISVNCIEGGQECQMAKNLVPLGLFEVRKENTELLRETLPSEFIKDIKSVKKIFIGSRVIDIRIRLGGDLMNAVHVFGLAGFSSNYPCIFCTQHKDDLHVTEDTAYDKTVTTGKGPHRKTTTVRISSTSYHDSTKRARSLTEQASCLSKKTNDLGYKCEPLFGDLFDYQRLLR